MQNLLVPPVGDLSELDTSAIWTVRYLDPSGFECQLSIEGSTGTEVLKKALSAIDKLKESQCIPITRGQTPAQDTEHYKEEELQCPIHKVKMSRWSKGNRTWYSHRWEGGWCKGGLS
jgi:hypothetical protein